MSRVTNVCKVAVEKSHSRITSKRVIAESLEPRRMLSSSNSLFTYDFEGTSSWPGASAKNTAANGTTSVYVLGKGAYGTEDTVNSTAASQGEEFQVEPPPTGTWSSVIDSGKLAVSNTITNLGLLTLRFSLKVSEPKPVQLYLNSYASSGASSPSGALQITLFPSCANTFEHYEVDLSTMEKSGANTLVPTAPYMSIAFEMNSIRGWTANTPTLCIDNVNFVKPSYYVQPGGSDVSGGGTSTSDPFATPAYAASVAGPGDIIELMTNGASNTFYVTTNPSNHGMVSNAIQMKTAGTPAQWITMKNYPGETPIIYSDWYNAIDIGDGNSGRQSAIPATAYIDVRGLTLQGNDATVGGTFSNGSTDVLTNGSGLSVDGRYMDNKPHDIVISDNTAENFPGGGFGAQEADRVSIHNNVVKDCCWWDVYADSGISIFSSYSFNTSATEYTRLIFSNTAYSNECFNEWLGAPGGERYSDGNGIIMDVNTGSQYDSTVAYGRSLVENNISFNNGGAGVNVTSADHTDVINNTTYMNGVSPQTSYAEVPVYDATDVNVVNNIMVAPSTDPVNYATPGGLSSVRWSNNLYDGGNAAPILGSNSQTGDPLFVNAADGDFKLSNTSSPAYNNGITNLAATTGFGAVTAPGSTIDNLLRYGFGAPDIGAYEYQG